VALAVISLTLCATLALADLGAHGAHGHDHHGEHHGHHAVPGHNAEHGHHEHHAADHSKHLSPAKPTGPQPQAKEIAPPPPAPHPRHHPAPNPAAGPLPSRQPQPKFRSQVKRPKKNAPAPVAGPQLRPSAYVRYGPSKVVRKQKYPAPRPNQQHKKPVNQIKSVATKTFVLPPPPAPPAPFKREIFPAVPQKANAEHKAVALEIKEEEEDVTKYLYPPYVAPKHIRQPERTRSARKAPLSPAQFVQHVARDVAVPAASAPVPVSVPFPAPQRVGRSQRYPANTNEGGLSGIFDSIKKRFGFKKSAPGPQHRRPQSGHVNPHPAQVRRQFNIAPPPASTKQLVNAKAESINGYQKFTLDEVVIPSKAAARNDDVKEDTLKYVDGPKETKKEKKDDSNKEPAEKTTVEKKEKSVAR
jgi:hypothetical protein